MLNVRIDNIGESIKTTKRALRGKLPDLKRVMAEVEEELKREVEVIATARAKGKHGRPDHRIPGHHRREDLRGD